MSAYDLATFLGGLRKAALAADEHGRQAARMDRPRLADYALSVLGLVHEKRAAAAVRAVNEEVGNAFGPPPHGEVWFPWSLLLPNPGADTTRSPAAEAFFRSHSLVAHAGAEVISGLKPGALELPMLTGAARWGKATTAGCEALSARALVIAPHPMHLQLIVPPKLLTAGPVFEGLLIEHLRRALASELDRVALAGGGGDQEPSGVAQHPEVAHFEARSGSLWETLAEADGLVRAAARADRPGPWIVSRSALQTLRTTRRTKDQDVIMSGAELLGRPTLVADGAGEVLVTGRWDRLLFALWGPGIQLRVSASDGGYALLEVVVEAGVGLLDPESFVSVKL